MRTGGDKAGVMTLDEFRTRRAEQKRKAVLSAAERRFIEAGYAVATIEAIARDAEVSTATVYSHFGSKADLFAAVVERAADAMRMERLTDLRSAARAYADLMADPALRGLMRLIIAESARFPELGEALFERGKAAVYDAFARAFQAEVKAGRLDAQKDWTLAASQITGMISQSVLMPWLIAGRDPVRDRYYVADAAAALFIKE